MFREDSGREKKRQEEESRVWENQENGRLVLVQMRYSADRFWHGLNSANMSVTRRRVLCIVQSLLWTVLVLSICNTPQCAHKVRRTLRTVDTKASRRYKLASIQKNQVVCWPRSHISQSQPIFGRNGPGAWGVEAEIRGRMGDGDSRFRLFFFNTQTGFSSGAGVCMLQSDWLGLAEFPDVRLPEDAAFACH